MGTRSRGRVPIKLVETPHGSIYAPGIDLTVLPDVDALPEPIKRRAMLLGLKTKLSDAFLLGAMEEDNWLAEGKIAVEREVARLHKGIWH